MKTYNKRESMSCHLMISYLQTPHVAILKNCPKNRQFFKPPFTSQLPAVAPYILCRGVYPFFTNSPKLCFLRLLTFEMSVQKENFQQTETPKKYTQLFIVISENPMSHFGTIIRYK